MTQLRAALGRSAHPTAASPPARAKRAQADATGDAPTPPEAASRPSPGWESVTLDDLTAASDLLDHLENRGVGEAELVVLGERSFLVRWRPPS